MQPKEAVGLCGKGTFLSHDQRGAHKDLQVLFCQAAALSLGPQSALNNHLNHSSQFYVNSKLMQAALHPVCQVSTDPAVCR